MGKTVFVGEFVTIPIKDPRGELGTFEHSIHADEDLILLSGDPRGYLMNMIAKTAAGLQVSMDIPLFLWTFIPSPMVRERTGLPETIPMGGLL